jgi:outer membrane protein assembly factor BamD (BamD/ComL family)
MKSTFNFSLVLASFFLVLANACTTEKNATMNRVYHQTNTKYNALYNANELIKTSMRAYRMVHVDDYDEILPIEVLPSEENLVAMYPIMDTVVSKCMKAIAKHSMPAFNRSVKKEEYNKWIDEAWLMTGYAKYYKGDFEGAIESFAYVEKFFNHKPAKYTARLWKAKCHVREGNLVKADAILRELERDADNFQKRQDEKKQDRKKKKSKSQKKKSKRDAAKEKPIAVPPDNFVYEYYKVKAEIAIIRKKYEDAQRFMEIVVSDIKNKEEAARMHFILAQLAVKNGQNPIGVVNYSQTLKKKAPFVLHFTARLQRAISSSGADRERLTAELLKMASESKNLEYRDQIYYALGNMAENENNVPKAMDFYSKSVYYSINNAKQKGQSYERMGNVKMAQREYVKAQKYYDSCTRVAPQDYKNRDAVVRKANKLRDLVDAIETAELQDSLLRIAAMSPAEQEAHLAMVKTKIEKEEKERIEREKAKAAELEAMRQNSQSSQGGSGNRWYFYNQRTRADGYEEFKRFWGQRELEDDWRRVNKIPSMTTAEVVDNPDLDSLLSAPTTKPVDKFSTEALRANIPQTEEEIQLAHEIMIEALYRSGRIYNEELLERELAIQQFEKVMTYRIEDKHILLSAFELYRLYDGVNPNQRAYYAEYITRNYPNSDYAKYILDPNYFVKKKERERLDLEDYEKQIERFRNGQYSAVRARTRSIVQNDPNNAYLSGYMLLYALTEAAMMSDKKGSIPFFENVIESFPGSKEAQRATTMIDIINKGLSRWEEVSFGSNSSEFEYRSDKMHFVLVANRGDKVSELKKDLSNFNSEFFGSSRLSTKAEVIGTDIDVIRVSSFKNEKEARDFRKAFQTAKRTVKHLQSHTFFIITNENYVKLIGGGNLQGYLKFYTEFY